MNEYLKQPAFFIAHLSSEVLATDFAGGLTLKVPNHPGRTEAQLLAQTRQSTWLPLFMC